MRTITVDFTTNKPIDPHYSGERGENNAVELFVIPGDDMTNDERIVTYYVAFKVDDGLVLSQIFSAGEEIRVPLGVDITKQRKVLLQLIAISEDGETVVSKSPIVALYIGESLEGEILPDPVTGETIYTQIAHLAEIAEHIDLAPIYEKLDTIETGAQVNKVDDVQDENGNSLVDNGVALIPNVIIEIKEPDSDSLAYNFDEIYGFWATDKVLTYNGYYITSVYPNNRYLRFYYIGETSPHAFAIHHVEYVRPTTINFDIVYGRFSTNDFTNVYKAKLDGIEAGAQVNRVNDVQDSEGVSLVTDGIAVLPEIPETGRMVEIYDKTELGVDYANITGSELYARSRSGNLFCYHGSAIVGMSANISDYYIYYIASGAIVLPQNYNCTLRRVTIGEDKRLTNDIHVAYFSERNYTEAEKNKLAGIYKGSIASGNQGYATGGDVYSVVGNVESALSSINTALEDLIGGGA